MRILQVSDLHLEFDPTFRIFNECNADILLLGGDIFVADYFTRNAPSPHYHRAEDVRWFFSTISQEFENIIYIAGNHEHYHGVHDENHTILSNFAQEFDNIHYLNNGSINVEGITIVGSTLWTSCNNRNPLTLNYLRGYLNDFRLIKKSKDPYRVFLPIDSAIEHTKAVSFIEREIQNKDKVIVMTHHLPSELSVHSMYKNYIQGNYGYFSNLEELILDNPQVLLWTHGHTHHSFDYFIGETRVFSNPRGYGNENSDFSTRKIIDL